MKWNIKISVHIQSFFNQFNQTKNSSMCAFQKITILTLPLIYKCINLCSVDMDKWKGKVAVVTGASAGIGAAITVGLAKSGLIVVGLARRAEKVEALKQKLGGASGELHAFECNVASYESVCTAFEWIKETFGGINVLVNNAGVYKWENLSKLSEFKYISSVFRNVDLLQSGEGVRNDLMETLDINVVGLIDCTREAFKIMKEKDEFGYIININRFSTQIIKILKQIRKS